METKSFTCRVVFIVALSSMCLSYSGGTGTGADPYKISTPADWQELMSTSSDWDKQFILTADIDLAGLSLTPVGNTSTKFTGVFDGNGHAIRNAVINTPDRDYVGLFGFVSKGGQIRNLGAENIAVTGRSYISGLCGRNDGVITSCYATGKVTGTKDYVGGLCGRNDGVVTSCYATGKVTGTEEYVGGLCGASFGTITYCFWGIGTGSTTEGEGDFSDGSGQAIEPGAEDITVTGRYDVGGLCGWNGGTIISCCATGSVTGTAFHVGGLCGENDGAIKTCYATGPVTGRGLYVGGLCGWNWGPVTSCFWDIETSGRTNGVGDINPDPDGVIGKTTLEMKMQSTFTNAGWDFVGETANGTADRWRMCSDGIDYPLLNWQYSFDGDFDCPNGVGLEDLLYLTQHWLETVANPFDSADVTGDKRVDIYDFTILSENWP